MRAKKVYEKISFERGQDPKKAMGIGEVRPYPSMSVEAFGKWFKREIAPYIDDRDWDNMVDNLFSNTWETDSVLAGYLMDRGMDGELIDELLPMRDYFNDKKYVKHLYEII